MPSIKIQPMTGEIPRSSANLLPDSGAQSSVNAKLWSGELRPWKKPSKVALNPIVASTQSLFQLYGTSSSVTLSWATDVDCVTSPLTDSTDYRVYFAGTGITPRKTNWSLATTSATTYPQAYLELGVPAPSSAPVAAVTTAGSGGTSETRTYLMTYISTFGTLKEESAPVVCAAITVAAPTGASVTINAFPALPTGNYNITARRFYRTLPGSSTYGQVGSDLLVSGGATSFVDNFATAVSPCQSLLWSVPPSDLQGLVTMPNGMVAGFRGREVWFCEPYYLHAWPPGYVQTVGSDIVGLGVFGTSLVVLTNTIPYVLTGTHPSAMSEESIQMPQPCIAKRTIAYDDTGVVYVSPNGVCVIGPGVRGVVSEWAFTRDEWQKLNPSYFFGKLYGQNYLLFNSLQDYRTRTAMIYPRQGTNGIGYVMAPATAFYVDQRTGLPYFAAEVENLLYAFDADTVNNHLYNWKSKRFEMPQPIQMTCLHVKADYTFMNDAIAINTIIAQIIAYNQSLFSGGAPKMGEINGGRINGWAINGNSVRFVPQVSDVRTINVTIYGDDGVQVHSCSVVGRDAQRMPDSFKSSNYEVLISGNVPVWEFGMATSIPELRAR